MKQIDLPDFDDMQDVIERIGALARKEESLKLDIIQKEATTIQACMTNPELFVGGKPPAMSYLEATVKRTGFNDEIMPLRRELAEVEAALEVCRKSYELLKIRIEVWRSLQANERAATL